ncbi:MAG TPA: L-threonylcarbamoyladenylate synthase [Acidimicrobiales bacterium]|nr:L-threonylcarbamoyladenylate synthase [Acidimicrobiales bacterium]
MPVVPALGDPLPDDAITAAKHLLLDGEIVAIPTDTVYGLAANPYVPGATERLFNVKQRPRAVSLPVLVSGIDEALSLGAAVPAGAVALMDRFWPGALTVVIPCRPDLGADLGDDEVTIGVRCPDHPVAMALCWAVGPLATTSANLHGQPTLRTAADVDAALGSAVPLVLDGGRCDGEPSTVVDCTGQEPKLLRDGRVPWADVREVFFAG